MAKADILLVGLFHAYQWRESSSHSPLEHEERQNFIKRVRQEIQQFQPNIVADEVADTDNQELLALLPIPPIFVDISDARKLDRQFNIERCRHFVCPYVDSIRERYWRYRLHHLVKEHLIKNHSSPRILMFLGALHLEPCFQRKAFPDLLAMAGYSVTSVNLYREKGWRHSWTEGWKHPTKPSDWTFSVKCCTISETYPYQVNQRCHYKVYWKEFLTRKAQEQKKQQL